MDVKVSVHRFHTVFIHARDRGTRKVVSVLCGEKQSILIKCSKLSFIHPSKHITSLSSSRLVQHTLPSAPPKFFVPRISTKIDNMRSLPARLYTMSPGVKRQWLHFTTLPTALMRIPSLVPLPQSTLKRSCLVRKIPGLLECW